MYCFAVAPSKILTGLRRMVCFILRFFFLYAFFFVRAFSGGILRVYWNESVGQKYIIVATIRVEPSVLVFLAFISKTVNNRCYNPYIFGKIFSICFQKCMGCIIGC